ncbi:MAG: ATP synthase subunit I [Methylophilaceae bacterium]
MILNSYPTEIKVAIKKILIIEIILAFVLLFLMNWHASLSLLLGGLSVVVGILVSSPIAYRKQNADKPSGIIFNALKAEAIKILTIVIMLWMVFKFYDYKIPFVIVIGLGIAALFSGVALTKLEK